ncbi:MAG: arginine--tRNA ligase [Spirochaetaceae bacterium]|jgi:arginyl-tRNA synthetase|nr:arginine--tRNA ligase [Spirochaetaceae bacterium]
MFAIDSLWFAKIAEVLHVPETSIIAELPPKPEMGDIGFPMFPFAKAVKKSPAEVALFVAENLSQDAEIARRGRVAALGPYLNVSLDRGLFAENFLAIDAIDAIDVIDDNGKNGENAAPKKRALLRGKRIMVEFSSPNTNKPLHLGHLRNDVLGESLARILRAAGADVRKVCIINDRGIHICKSMLAYQELGGGATPESAGVKSDRFVGDWYVRFHRLAETDKDAENRARELLRKWEAGDAQTAALWNTMNGWAIDGIKATYKRTGVSFDRFYFESGTYLLGKDKIAEGLADGVFYREEDGSVWIDLEVENLGKKALLRRDGTSLYITQDIGTAISRHNDWPFDRLIYVVGSEQIYHFKVLFSILRKLRFPWAADLYHLSYGMVNLPEGKMKSREGTVVDADDLIDELRDLALAEIREKEREDAVGDPGEVAEKIALGALHYYLQQTSPSKDMLFNPQESLSFNGNTGPYLQYMGARISSMLKKAGDVREAEPQYGLLSGDAEWDLLKTAAGFENALTEAALHYDSSIIAAYCYDLAKSFSRFYHDCPILNCEDKALAQARLALSKRTLAVLKDALDLICVPFLETM